MSNKKLNSNELKKDKTNISIFDCAVLYSDMNQSNC